MLRNGHSSISKQFPPPSLLQSLPAVLHARYCTQNKRDVSTPSLACIHEPRLGKAMECRLHHCPYIARRTTAARRRWKQICIRRVHIKINCNYNREIWYNTKMNQENMSIGIVTVAIKKRFHLKVLVCLNSFPGVAKRTYPRVQKFKDLTRRAVKCFYFRYAYFHLRLAYPRHITVLWCVCSFFQ